MLESEIGFMCYVEGSSRPKRFHLNYDIAYGEALRLSGLEPTRNIYVLGVVAKILPTQAMEATEVTKQPVVTIKKKRLLDTKI